MTAVPRMALFSACTARLSSTVLGMAKSAGNPQNSCFSPRLSIRVGIAFAKSV